ncbi:MAG: alpha/beta hydrolase-fold protein [Candidatus Neomarinimicrobiota bacterium]
MMQEELNTIGHIGLEPLSANKVEFFSNALQRNMIINIMLPRGYFNSEVRYPVLYLCHGLTSNYREFEFIGVPEYLNRFDMIIVTVDVGNSWYVNWVKSENGQLNNYSDHITQDIIGYIDKNYRTIADRKGRAINGISMGGFGAMSIGLSHPELFCSVASASGALEYAKGAREQIEKGEEPFVIWEQVLQDTITRYRDINLDEFSTFRERTPKGKPFLTVEDADKVDPFKLVLQIPKEQLPHIYFDCGLEDWLTDAAKEFMRVLLDNDIPFTYSQSAGTHEEDYWGREIQKAMAIQYSVMLENIWGRKFEIYDAWKTTQEKTAADSTNNKQQRGK